MAITPQQAQRVRDLFAARDLAKTPQERALISKAIHDAARGQPSAQYAYPIKKEGRVVGVETAKDVEAYHEKGKILVKAKTPTAAEEPAELRLMSEVHEKTFGKPIKITPPSRPETPGEKELSVMAYVHETAFKRPLKLSGLSPQKRIELIEKYGSRYGTFEVDGKRKTWWQIKKENPAAYMKASDGKITVVTDTERWRKEQYEQMSPESATVRRGLATFLGGFANWDYIYASMTGDPVRDAEGQRKRLSQIIDDWEYQMHQFGKEGNIAGVVLSIPVVTNVFLPAAMGSVFGTAFRVAQYGIGLIASQGFQQSAKVAQIALYGGSAALGGTAIYSAGQDIVKSYQEDASKGLIKGLTYATQFASFGAGAKIAMEYKPMAEYGMKPSKLKFRGKKPIIESTTPKPLKLDIDMKLLKRTQVAPKAEKFGMKRLPIERPETIDTTIYTKFGKVDVKITTSPTQMSGFKDLSDVGMFPKMETGKYIWGRQTGTISLLEQISAMEEGVYVIHPRWTTLKSASMFSSLLAVIPKMTFGNLTESMVGQISKLSFIPIISLKSLSRQKISYEQRDIQSLFPVSSLRTDLMQSDLSLSLSQTKQSTFQLQSQMLKSASVTKQVTEYSVIMKDLDELMRINKAFKIDMKDPSKHGGRGRTHAGITMEEVMTGDISKQLKAFNLKNIKLRL